MCEITVVDALTVPFGIRLCELKVASLAKRKICRPHVAAFRSSILSDLRFFKWTKLKLSSSTIKKKKPMSCCGGFIVCTPDSPFIVTFHFLCFFFCIEFGLFPFQALSFITILALFCNVSSSAVSTDFK